MSVEPTSSGRTSDTTGLGTPALGIAVSCGGLFFLYRSVDAGWQATWDQTWAGDAAFLLAWRQWMLAWPLLLAGLVLFADTAAARGHYWLGRLAGILLIGLGGGLLWAGFPDEMLSATPIGLLSMGAGVSQLVRWKHRWGLLSVAVIFLVLSSVSTGFITQWSDYSASRRELLRRDWIALAPAKARLHFDGDDRFVAEGLPSDIACFDGASSGLRNVSGRWWFEPGSAPNRKIVLTDTRVEGGPCASRGTIVVVRKPFKLLEIVQQPATPLRFVPSDAPVEMRERGIHYAERR